MPPPKQGKKKTKNYAAPLAALAAPLAALPRTLHRSTDFNNREALASFGDILLKINK